MRSKSWSCVLTISPMGEKQFILAEPAKEGEGAAAGRFSWTATRPRNSLSQKGIFERPKIDLGQFQGQKSCVRCLTYLVPVRYSSTLDRLERRPL